MTRFLIMRFVASAVVLLLGTAGLVMTGSPVTAAGSGRISGSVVREEGGSPFAAGDVRLYAQSWSTSAGSWVTDVATTTLGSDGTFTLTGLNDGEKYRVRAAPSSGDAFPATYAEVTARAGAAPQVVITVLGYRTVTGTIRMPDGSVPTPNSLQVGGRAWDAIGLGWGPSCSCGYLAADGTFTVRHLLPGLTQITVDYLGAGIVDSPNELSDPYVYDLEQPLAEQVAIQLIAASTVTGRVDVGITGNAAKPDEFTLFFTSPKATALTTVQMGAGGTYSASGLFTGRWRVYVYRVDEQGSGGSDYGALLYIDVVGGQDGVLNVLMPVETGIGGTVRSGGAPVAGVTVTASRYLPDRPSYLGSYSTVTDADGRFVLETPGGRFDLRVEDPLGRFGSSAWSARSFYDVPDYFAVDTGEYADDFEIEVAQAAHLVGTVTGGGLTPSDLAAGDVTIGIEYRAAGSSAWVDTGFTRPVSAAGSFDIGDLSAGTYRFTALYDGPRGRAQVQSAAVTFVPGERTTWNALLPAPQAYVTVYRFWSPSNRSHFYTSSPEERAYILDHYPASTWSYEGPVYTAFERRAPGTVPLYRFWSGTLQGHFYTTSEAEKKNVIDAFDDSVWAYEGIAYYVYPADADVAGTLAVSRFWSGSFGHHFYTADAGEARFVKDTYPQTWSYEGTAFRVPDVELSGARGEVLGDR